MSRAESDLAAAFSDEFAHLQSNKTRKILCARSQHRGSSRKDGGPFGERRLLPCCEASLRLRDRRLYFRSRVLRKVLRLFAVVGVNCFVSHSMEYGAILADKSVQFRTDC